MQDILARISKDFALGNATDSQLLRESTELALIRQYLITKRSVITHADKNYAIILKFMAF